MSRTVAGIWWSPTMEGTPALVVAAAFFTLGGLSGNVLAFRITGEGQAAMAAYLERFLYLARTGALSQPSLPELLWRSLRWPLGAVLLGFSILGLLGIPALCALRGFFFAFSVTSFALSYGHNGLAAAFLLLGIPALLSIPALLVLATQSFSSACVLAGRSARRESPFGRDYFFRCGICALAFFASLLLECYLVPPFMAGAAELLF